MDESASSDDGRNDEEDESDDDVNGISKPMMVNKNNELEEGVIGMMDVDQVEELNRENLRVDNDNSPVVVQSLGTF